MKLTVTSSSVRTSAICTLAALLTACSSSTYVVQVDAISHAEPLPAGTPPPQSYTINTNNPKMDPSSLRYQEVAGYVKTALSGKGMYEAPSPDKADVVVDIDYGMHSPRVKFETMTYPIHAPVGGGMRYEQVPIFDAKGRMVGTRTMAVHEPPRMEIIGYEDTVRPVVVYEKYLSTSARLNREAVEGRAAPEVWSVNVSAEDESKDIRKYLPILASATADHIGENTNSQKPVKIKEGDEVVSFIKKGM